MQYSTPLLLRRGGEVELRHTLTAPRLRRRFGHSAVQLVLVWLLPVVGVVLVAFVVTRG